MQHVNVDYMLFHLFPVNEITSFLSHILPNNRNMSTLTLSILSAGSIVPAPCNCNLQCKLACEECSYFPVQIRLVQKRWMF